MFHIQLSDVSSRLQGNLSSYRGQVEQPRLLVLFTETELKKHNLWHYIILREAVHTEFVESWLIFSALRAMHAQTCRKLQKYYAERALWEPALWTNGDKRRLVLPLVSQRIPSGSALYSVAADRLDGSMYDCSGIQLTVCCALCGSGKIFQLSLVCLSRGPVRKGQGSRVLKWLLLAGLIVTLYVMTFADQ